MALNIAYFVLMCR